MFFFAALFVAGFILTAFFGPKPKIENARSAALSDFNFPRAKEGDPVPRIYGTVKVKSVNTIYMGDFKTIPIKKKVKTGLFSSKKQIIGYENYIGLDLAVCLGPNIVYRKMWYGKDLIWTGCLYDGDCVNEIPINLPELMGGKEKNGGLKGTIALYCGSFNQPQDAYLVSKLGANVPAYVGIAHMVFRQFYWGNSPSIQPVYVEVASFSDSLGLANGPIMLNGLDINPIECLYDLYVNNWGNLDVDPAAINVEQWREIGNQIYEENIYGISLEIANANTGGELTKEIIRQINAMLYQDPQTGKINIRLIRQDYNIEDLPVLSPSEVKIVRNYSKKLWEATYNRVRIKYIDRAKGYVDSIAIQDDFSNIGFQNRIRASEIGMPGIYDPVQANYVAARELANLNVPLFQAELEFDRTKSNQLSPGQPFVLHWPEYEIEAMVMRIRKFDLGALNDGRLIAFATQDEFAVDATVFGTPELPIPDGEDYQAKDIEDFLYFELPPWMDRQAEEETRPGYTRFATYVLKPGAASLDYTAIIDDPVEDVEALENAPYADTAEVAITFGQYEGFVTGIAAELTIKNVSNVEMLTNTDLAGIREGANMLIIGNEIVSYTTFTDNGDDTYTLNNVHRSMLDTGWFEHAEDELVWFVDGAEGFWDTDVLPVDFTAYLLDRSATGRGAELTAVQTLVEPVGRVELPAPPDNVTADAARTYAPEYSAGDTVTIAWAERSRLAFDMALETDASASPDVGTTYKLQLLDGGGSLLFEEDAIAVPTFDLLLPIEASGVSTVLVFAEQDGKTSYSAAPFPITVLSDALTIDGELVEVDGEYVEFT